MMMFGEIVSKSDLEIQNMLRQIGPAELAIALKGAGKPVTDAILRNMSVHAKSVMAQDIEALAPPPVEKTEAMRKKIAGLFVK